MSYIEAGRMLPKYVGDPRDTAAYIRHLENTLLVIETWFNDVFAAINAGTPEAVDTENDLPPIPDAFGKIYFLMVSAGTGAVAPNNARFVGSDGTSWLRMDQ